MSKVIRGLIDTVVVLHVPMSTRWTSMLEREFDSELRQYASRVPSPCGLTVIYNISPPVTVASNHRLY